LTTQELSAGLEEILHSPRDGGRVELIVRRPGSGQREVLQEAFLDLTEGLVGDNWRQRGSYATADGSPHPEMQVTLMNSRAILRERQVQEAAFSTTATWRVANTVASA
jgi:hypothetical protein